MSDARRSATSARWFPIWRLLPLAMVGVGAAAFFALGLDDLISFGVLRANRAELLARVADHRAVAAAAFVAVYAAAILFLPPTGTVMTVVGGFVFGAVFGTFLVVLGATLGATALFLVARLALGDVLKAKAGPALKRMEAGFRENALSYLLVLRLVPVFPFWLVNIAPAFLGVRPFPYIVGTFFGIIPGTAVYATFGAGLGEIFDVGHELTLKGVLSPEIVIGLTGLAVLALVPVAYKRFRHRAL